MDVSSTIRRDYAPRRFGAFLIPPIIGVLSLEGVSDSLSARRDEEVGASVVLRDGAALDASQLIAYCAKNMSYFMVPRFVEFLADLPVTVNQKVEKFRLKSRMEADTQAVWDRERAGIVLER